LHLRPLLINALLQTHEPIVSAPEKEADNECDEKDDDQHSAATDREFVHKIEN
jgi:hypothetical protein